MKRKRKKEKGIVYFIRDGKGCIKIGITNNLSKRLATLQTGNAQTLKCYHYIETRNMDEARELEAKLHKKFKRQRIRSNGEWFRERKVVRWIRWKMFIDLMLGLD